LFSLVNATVHHEILSVESVGPAQTFLKCAKGYKSPGKFEGTFIGHESNIGFTHIVTSRGILKGSLVYEGSFDKTVGIGTQGLESDNEDLLGYLQNKVRLNQDIIYDIVE
jgi:hypothetical protein